jgi:hypothetical protein
MKYRLLVLILLHCVAVHGQVRKKIGSVEVEYHSAIENYALSLSKILDAGIGEAKNKGFKFPKKINLTLVETDRVLVRDNGSSLITIEYDSMDKFIPPSNAYFICYTIDRLGMLALMHIVQIKGLKKMTWMNSKFRYSWSLYFASNIIDPVYEQTSDTIWPIPYNFKKHGKENLDKISKDEQFHFYHEINAWIDLGNHIGFETFAEFFSCFEKGGCSKDAFIKAIHQFLDAEAAKQWEDKYLEYLEYVI